MPLLPRFVLDIEEEVFYTRKPKAVIIFPSSGVRMNYSLRWSACQSERTWLLSDSKNQDAGSSHINASCTIVGRLR